MGEALRAYIHTYLYFECLPIGDTKNTKGARGWCLTSMKSEAWPRKSYDDGSDFNFDASLESVIARPTKAYAFLMRVALLTRESV
jgi:hypothetical protein